MDQCFSTALWEALKILDAELYPKGVKSENLRVEPGTST